MKKIDRHRLEPEVVQAKAPPQRQEPKQVLKGTADAALATHHARNSKNSHKGKCW